MRFGSSGSDCNQSNDIVSVVCEDRVLDILATLILHIHCQTNLIRWFYYVVQYNSSDGACDSSTNLMWETTEE
jgi:hypothetical protein